MPYSYLDRLECPRCGKAYDAAEAQGLCQCGSPLLARYALRQLARDGSRGMTGGRTPSLWRYHELLPVSSAESVVTLGEGLTPMVPLQRLARRYGLSWLVMKDEGLLPTGTFKARGAAVGVSRARELEVKQIAMPSNGNAAASWAAYAARAGLQLLVVMPADAPAIARAECVVAGAELYLVDGLIDDAGAMVARAVGEGGWTDVATLKEPYRLEGKKTIGLEIAEQLGWRMPDVIVYPTGGGVGLIGMHKAFQELRALGWVEDELPRFVAVQASGCAPIVRAFLARQRSSEAWPDASTVAFGITVPKPLGDFLILDALYGTGGIAHAVDDTDILQAERECAELEGAFICPEGAATLAAVVQLRRDGWLSGDDRVLVINTGTGLKYPETVHVDVPVLAPGESIEDNSGRRH